MRILITDDVYRELPGWLREKGHQVQWQPYITYEEMLTVIPEYQGIIVSTRIPIDRQLIGAGEALAFIARVGSGMEHIDTRFAESRGIRVVSSPEGNANAVAEHALGLLLGLVRHIPRAVDEVRHGKWLREANRGLELKGRTIGIIGVGHTGKAFATRLRGLEMNVIGYDKYTEPTDIPGLTAVGLQEIFNSAEIISFHVPLNEETRYYLNDEFIGFMRNPFFLINTSRGQVVSSSSLIAGLKNDKVLGAALDVLENERLDDLSAEESESLQTLQSYGDRVLITPHIAGWTQESRYKLSAILLEKLEDLL